MNLLVLMLEGEKFVEHLRTAKEKMNRMKITQTSIKENSHFTELKRICKQK